MKIIQLPFAPLLLISAIPYLQYYGVYSIYEAHRAALFFAIATFCIMAFLTKVLNSWQKSGVIVIILSSIILITYREVTYPIIIFLFLVLSTILERRFAYTKIIVFSNVLSLVFLIGTLYPLFSNIYASRHFVKTTTKPLELIDLASTPSIMHIALDGYGSSEVLSNIYKHNNVGFQSALEELGFQVMPKVITPYNQTLFVMSSIMSGGYINTPSGTDNVEAYRLDLGHTATKGPVQQIFRNEGYNFSYSKSGYAYLDYDAAELVTPSPIGLTGFEANLLSSFPELSAKNHNQILKAALSSEIFSMLRPPFFYYQHLMAPHPPFTLTAKGLERPTQSVFLFDGSHVIKRSPERRDRYIKGYKEKAEFVEDALLKQMKSIPKNDPIIVIIHGDHGPGAHFDQESSANSCTAERMTTFFAIYSNVPVVREAFAKHKNTEFNLVNIYRIIFSSLSKHDFAPLQSKATFLRWSDPSDAVKISKGSFLDSCLTKYPPLELTP